MLFDSVEVSLLDISTPGVNLLGRILKYLRLCVQIWST